MQETFCDLLRRAEQVFLKDGYPVRFRRDPPKWGGTEKFVSLHYGKPFALIDDKIVVKATQEMQDQLAQLLSSPDRQSIIAEKLAHLQPEAVRPAKMYVSKFLMEFLEKHSSNYQSDLARIIAHKSRKWDKIDLSDMIGQAIDMTANITVKSNKVGCNANLGHNITVNDKSITIRKLNLPEAILINMQENGSKMTVKQIVDHPYLPDFAISSIDCNESRKGKTIVIWQAEDYLDIVDIG